jgi:hypothetical protein
LATFSQYYGLKLNASSDPFQLSDFITNWGILDASPGIYITTSGARPAWSSGQAGRLIFMTDIKQLSYFDGAAWNDLRDSAPIFYAGIAPQAVMSPGSSPTFSICTFTTPRPCALAIWITMTIGVNPNGTNPGTTQTCGVIPTLDGTGYPGVSTDSHTILQWDTLVPAMAVVPTVTAGSHTIGINLSIVPHAGSMYLATAKAIGMISLYSGSNAL